MFYLFALVLVKFIPAVFTSSNQVLVLSFDGFKPSYIDESNTPNLLAFRNKAAWPKTMKSIFPSKTFATHFTVATGNYPGSHGVYGNEIFDKNGKKIFNTEDQFTTNQNIVPIWIDNQNVTNEVRNSGVMMWPGSQFAYDGKKPTHLKEYDENVKWEDRVGIIFNWMTQTEQKANLVMAYFENSPLSYDVNEKKKDLKQHIQKVDNLVGIIQTKINELQLQDEIDIIIMSGECTQEVLGTGVLIIEDYLQGKTPDFIVDGPIVYIRPANTTDFDDIRKKLSEMSYDELDGKLDVYIKTNLPFKWHMRDLDTLKGIIILVALPNYTFYTKNKFAEDKGSLTSENFAVEVNRYEDNDAPMKTLFMGNGPSFKINEKIEEELELIEVYSLLRKLLNLSTEIKENRTKYNMTAKIKSLLKPEVL